MERIAAGIDLGNTYSCISVIDETMRPVVVQNKEGSKVTPSVVYFENDDNLYLVYINDENGVKIKL